MGSDCGKGRAATQRMPLAWPERSPGNDYFVDYELTTAGTCQGHEVPWSRLDSSMNELRKFQWCCGSHGMNLMPVRWLHTRLAALILRVSQTWCPTRSCEQAMIASSRSRSSEGCLQLKAIGILNCTHTFTSDSPAAISIINSRKSTTTTCPLPKLLNAAKAPCAST